MKSLFFKMLSLALSAAMMVNFAITAYAAPSRNTGTTKFLSEVALIEAKDKTEADKIFAQLKTEENGAFDSMIALDLNNGGNKKVYLVYKTSTNVDDAITDLAVMNMNGDFTMGNYEQLLNETIDNYKLIASDYRKMSLEFKENYEAGEFGAVIAHRQMNYYYIENDGAKTYMGDYMLNFPEDVTEFAKIMFGGNLNILTNLRSLMSMAVGDRNTNLKDRIIASYAHADESVYTNSAYEETAESMLSDIAEAKRVINNYELEIKKTEESELDDEAKQYSKDAIQNEYDTAEAFINLLKEIPMGETTLGDYVMNTPVIELQKLFPIIAATTEGEALMMNYHSFYTLLLYDVLEQGEAALSEMLTEFEKDFEPLSVYHGVQNDLAAGTIGVTGDAEILSSTTGKSFISGQAGSDYTTLKNVGYAVLGAAGVASMVGGIVYLSVKKSAAVLNYTNLTSALDTAKAGLAKAERSLRFWMDEFTGHAQRIGGPNGEEFAKLICGDNLTKYTNQVTQCGREVQTATMNLANANTALTGGQIAIGVFSIALGAVMMGISIWRIIELNNKYEPKYTEIPDNMVDVVSNDEFGDRFINYKNVPSYRLDGDKAVSRENDLNAYNGVQWVSLYYTKNYEAGYCLTATADLIAEETVRTGYTGIHLFGHKSNFNLNSYCNRDGAEDVYLAFKYSTKQKSAVTDIPSVIGTVFNPGVIAISSCAGLALGMALMGFIKRDKKKAEAEAAL